MTPHARLKNEFTEDEKYGNLMRWLILIAAEVKKETELSLKTEFDRNTGEILVKMGGHIYPIDPEFSCDHCTRARDPGFTVSPRGPVFEPPHAKNNKVACAPSEDSEIRLGGVFAVRFMGSSLGPKLSLSGQRRL